MKKRLISLLLALVACAGLLGVPAYAADGGNSCGNGVTWSLSSDGVLTISTDGTPGPHDMKNYTNGSDAPWGHEIRSLIIEDGVTSIGFSAFRDCNRLTSVVIPNSVATIGAYAFLDCGNLASVTIPDSVTAIGSRAFYFTPWYRHLAAEAGDFVIVNNILLEYLGSDTEAVIPDGTTRIGDAAFQLRDNVTSVIIPDSVTSIGQVAFWYCTSLASITIPDSVSIIEAYAFSNCTSLTSATIPNSVTTIGACAFNNCTALTDVYYGGSEEQWDCIEIDETIFYATATEDGNTPLLSATIHCSGPTQPAGSSEGPGQSEETDKAPRRESGFPMVPAVIIAAAVVAVIVVMIKKKGTPASAPVSAVGTVPPPAQTPPPHQPGSTPNFCPNCGQKLGPGTRFCPNCGKSLIE